MIKKGKKTTESVGKGIRKILITQPRPESPKSPYFEIARKHNVELEFITPHILIKTKKTKLLPTPYNTPLFMLNVLL